jgi:two-component system, OmpR family, phosphate regulon sensor histidine kinase PhoR
MKKAGCSETRATSEIVKARQSAHRLMTWSAGPRTGIQDRPDLQSVLLAIAGHDLRQPLQAIQSVHELLGRGIRTKTELQLLRTGQSAVDRMTTQLDLLLAALRLNQPQELKLTSLQLGPLIEQVGHENEFAALRRGIRLRVVPNNTSVHSDPFLLSAVLRNLVTNAVKYTDPGGRILVGCRHIGERVRIDVYDTGIGIVGEQMPQIFEAFSCRDSARSSGFGIGLFIVRQAVGLLGHQLEIASAPSRGSRFSILAKKVEEATA